jgi:AcrR family transcriptional regulator
MRSHFGSKDEAIIEHVISRLNEVAQDIEEDDEEAADAYRNTVSSTVRTVVMHGPPIEGLEYETDPHFGVACVLAMYEQEVYDVESNGWKMGAFWQFQEDYLRKLATDAQPLLKYLIDGRPMFASSMEVDWSYYAYLSRDEVRILMASLRQLQKEEPALVGQGYLDGFVDTFIGWLAAIDERGMDLWHYAT